MFLDKDAKELLGKIFDYNISSESNVNFKKFRADHIHHRDLLSDLEKYDYLEKLDNETYSLSLYALAELKDDNELVKKLLAEIEVVFDILQSHYQKHQDEKIFLTYIDDQTDFGRQKVNRLISYLDEISGWWSQRSNQNWDESFIVATEEIITWKSFSDFLTRKLVIKTEQIKKDRDSEDFFTQLPFYKQEVSTNYRSFINQPEWYDQLSPQIIQLLDEIYYGLEKELSALPSMGLRTVIDMVCSEQIGDKGTFGEKLRCLVDEGYITERNKVILENTLEVGHASAHRGYFPSVDTLKKILEIINHLLRETYVLGKVSEEIIKDVPPRNEI